MLHIRSSSRVVGGCQEHWPNRRQKSIIFNSPPCKHLQVIPHSPFNSVDFRGFNLHSHQSHSTSPRAHKPLVRNLRFTNTPHDRRVRGRAGFKLQCFSKSVNSSEKKGHGGELSSIVRSLATESEVEKTFDLYFGNLGSRDLTVVLKEQSSWEKVLRVFEWMRSREDYVPNEIHYNVVLCALGRAQKWDELRLCWINMAKDGVRPANYTYGTLVDVYGRAGLVKEALLWIKHMMLGGIFPDEVTMNTMVRVFRDAGDYDRADRFYRDWCNGKINFDDLDLDSIDVSGTSSSSEPISLKQFLGTELFKTGVRNRSEIMEAESSPRKPQLTSTYNTLIDLYGKAGRLKDAADAFSEMLKSGVALDAFTFNTMIFICGSLGDLGEAEALLHKMEEREISPNTKTYNIFLSLYADAGNIDLAFRYYRKIREVGLFPDDATYNAILHMLCKKKMLREVDAVIKEIESLGKRFDKRALPVVMELYINEGLTKRANALLEKCQLIGGLPSKTYAAIMDVYANHGLWVEAEDVFFGKRDKRRQQKTVLEYNVMVKAYGMAKLYDKAFSLFKGMKSQGIWPDDCTYNSLIQMFSQGDLVNQAKKLLIEMQDFGFKPSLLSFSAVIACYVRMNRLSDAVDTFQEMLKLGVEPNVVVYGSLIDGFAEAGEFEEAINYFHKMEESGVSANQIILTSMIKAHIRLESVEGAKHLYERIKNLDEGPDIVAANCMLNTYASFGMLSEAKSIFRDLHQKGRADGVTFATMIYAYKNMGMIGEALDIAEEMKQSGILKDCNAFSSVMACYYATGQLVECGELLHEMVDQKLLPDYSTFKILFTILEKGDFPDEAVRQLKSCYKERKDHTSQAVITSVFSVVGLHAFALEYCETFLKPVMGLHSFAYNVAIYAYAASGKTDEALNIFMKMQDVGVEPDVVTYVNLVSCYGKARLVQGIERIYAQLKHGVIEHNESLYDAVIDAYKDAGRHDLAYLVTQEMRFASSDDEEQDPNSDTEDASDDEEMCSNSETEDSFDESFS